MPGGPEAVDKVDSLSQKCKHFFEEMQAAASHGAAFLAAPHVCGLSSVFSDAHVAGKNNSFHSVVCGRRNSARLLQKL